MGYRWGVDFARPLPRTKKGNRYVLVMIEHFTKWLELVALPNKTSKLTARALLEGVLARFGAPAKVLTDQGTEIRGEFQTLLAHHGIDHRLASKEHPQSDGLAERMVQTMKRSLRKSLTKGAVKDSDLILPYVAVGYSNGH